MKEIKFNFLLITESEILILIFIFIIWIYSYFKIKENNKITNIKTLTLEELIKESKKELWVDKVTEKDIKYLKTLWTPEEQYIKQKIIINFENKNAIITLSILSIWLTLIFAQILFSIWYWFNNTERNYYIWNSFIILVFFISLPIAINHYTKRKQIPSYYLWIREYLLIYLTPIISLYCIISIIIDKN